MTDRLFALDEYPEIPLVRSPARRKSDGDARFRGDYPPQWDRCQRCEGYGGALHVSGERIACPDCLGMGSLKARVRLEAGHRCLRCHHPYVPKGDAAMLGIEPSWQGDGWSTCDDECRHGGLAKYWTPRTGWGEYDGPDETIANTVHARWRILTVHHADGDKANVRWWNLLALCQRCHLEIQAKVVLERVYVLEHSDWFKPFVAGYYAHAYLGEDLTREQAEERLEELLALERAA